MQKNIELGEFKLDNKGTMEAEQIVKEGWQSNGTGDHIQVS